MKILSINAGSSSLKFTLYKMPEEEKIVTGQFERIGIKDGSYKIKVNGEKIEKQQDLKDHKVAINILLKELIDLKIIEDLNEIKAVGHRVVQGADKYDDSVIITDEVVKDIEKFSSLAPLHNPANLIGYQAVKEKLSDAKHVAIFDTAFHQSISKVKYTYPLPLEFLDLKVRKYGFHGTSHKYITEYMEKYLNKEKVNLIICHIGNGASITAVKDSKSFDTSMGFTPVSGLMMGTRCGDIDVSIAPYIMEKLNITIDEFMNICNKKSGLLGVSEYSSDSRDIEAKVEEKDEKAILATDIYADKVVNYIANYYFALEGKLDGIVFTAGIGENSAITRKRIIDKLKCIDIFLDEKTNDETRGDFGIISSKDSKYNVYVVPTDEEVEIARDTYRLTK